MKRYMTSDDHYAGLDGDLLGHLAEDVGVTPEQLQADLPTDVSFAGDDQIGHLARDANMTEDEYRAEAGVDRPSGEGDVGFATSAPG